MPSYVYIGPYPTLTVDGQPVAVDQVLDDVDESAPYNALMIANGWLVEHDPSPAKQDDQEASDAVPEEGE